MEGCSVKDPTKEIRGGPHSNDQPDPPSRLRKPMPLLRRAKTHTVRKLGHFPNRYLHKPNIPTRYASTPALNAEFRFTKAPPYTAQLEENIKAIPFSGNKPSIELQDWKLTLPQPLYPAHSERKDGDERRTYGWIMPLSQPETPPFKGIGNPTHSLFKHSTPYVLSVMDVLIGATGMFPVHACMTVHHPHSLPKSRSLLTQIIL